MSAEKQVAPTPGPWLIADDDKTFVYALGPNDTNSFWAHVMAAGPEKVGRDELRANAKLIASAPLLLEALQRTLNYLSSYQGNGAASAYDQARAAIAAATDQS